MPKKLFVVVLLLSAVAAVAATTDSNTQPATATPDIKTYLMPDFSFRSVFSLDLLQQSATPASQPDNPGIAIKFHGTCRCSCGYPCTTSADCGGVSCDPFPTCCARTGQNLEAGWFTRSFEFSSHKTAQPDAVLKEIVKAECK
jgi:hypothetical protein